MLRLRTYLTIFSAIIFPLVMLLWVRSHVYNDTIFRVGGDWAIMVDSIDGEIAAWVGPIRTREKVIYQHDAIERGYGMRTSDLLLLVPTSRHLRGLGFDYAELDEPPMGWRNVIGTIRCVSLPLWFLALLSGVLPARCVMSGMYWTSASAAGRCPSCRFLLSPHHLRCPECGNDIAGVDSHIEPGDVSLKSSDDPHPGAQMLLNDGSLNPLPGPGMQWEVFITEDRRRRRDLV
jgi:hypothetical protein